MKLITAIVNRRDANKVCDALTKNRFPFTKMATMGGFLKAGNVTLFIGTEDSNVEKVIALIRKNSARRMESVKDPDMLQYTPTPEAGAVIVGGATVFVTNVERFEKM